MRELKFYWAFVDDFSKKMDNKQKSDELNRFNKEELEKQKRTNRELAQQLGE